MRWWVLLESGEPPALVGLSLAFQHRAKDFLALAMALRQRGYTGHITAGGYFGTSACRDILRDFVEIDSICRSDLPVLPDLERIPCPDRRGAPAESLGHRMAPLVASRGCYGHCAFCCISVPVKVVK